MANRTINLAYTRKAAPVVVPVVQYTTAPDIVFVLEDYTPTGSAQIFIDKPSGEEIYNTCTISGNTVIFTPTTQCFAEVGENKAQLQLLDGDKMAVSFLITFLVEENIIDDDAVESQSEFTELQQAISTIGQYDQRIQNVQDEMDEVDTNLRDDMNTLREDVNDELNTTAYRLETMMSSIEAQVDILEDEYSEMLTSITGVDTKVNTLSDKVLKNITIIGSGDNIYALDVGVYWYPSTSIPYNVPWRAPSIVEVYGTPDQGAAETKIPKLIKVTKLSTPGQTCFTEYYSNEWKAWREVVTAEMPLGNDAGYITRTERGFGYISGSSSYAIIDVPIGPFPRSKTFSLSDFSSINVTLRGISGLVYDDEGGPMNNALVYPESPAIKVAASLPNINVLRLSLQSRTTFRKPPGNNYPYDPNTPIHAVVTYTYQYTPM